MRLTQPLKILSAIGAVCLWFAGVARGQTATSVSGLYYTGMNASGAGLQTQGTTDSHWKVTYASTNGGTSANTTYQGAPYVLTSTAISGSGYTPNTTTSQWITAPGATNSAGTNPNTGGDFLPGNGDTGSNEGVYVYTLAFQINGAAGTTDGATVANKISMSLTISADDQFSIYVNPAGNGASVPTGTAAFSATSAWSNKASATLANYVGTGTDTSKNNSAFVIGTNYMVIVVDNTNSATGSSGSTALNASGLLFYDASNSVLIDGKTVNGVIPEAGTWLPVVGALGLFGWGYWRRRANVGSVS